MRPFHFNWSAFSLVPGIKFAVTILMLILLTQFFTFSSMLVGVSIFMGWIVIVLGAGKNSLMISTLYIVVGALLTWVSILLADMYWPWVVFMFTVTFVSTLLIRIGMHWFILGWALTYWILLSPVLYKVGGGQELLKSHLIGSTIILVLLIIEKYVLRKRAANLDQKDEKEEQLAPWDLVITYAFIVSIVVVIGLMLGHKYLSTDPTLIANASFMVIGFSMQNTWKSGLERMLAALVGITLGFYTGELIANEMVGHVLGIVLGFIAFSSLNVNNGIVVFITLAYIGFGYGVRSLEGGDNMANERILTELIGISLAGVGITLLNYITRFYKWSVRRFSK